MVVGFEDFDHTDSGNLRENIWNRIVVCIHSIIPRSYRKLLSGSKAQDESNPSKKARTCIHDSTLSIYHDCNTCSDPKWTSKVVYMTLK